MRNCVDLSGLAFRVVEGGAQVIRLFAADKVHRVPKFGRAAVVGDEDRAYELVERARMAVATEDSELVDEAADRIEAGADAARAHLIDTILPGALRERLMIRP